MQCDQNPIALAAYLDGELPPEQAASVRAHIATCSQCAAEVAELVNLRQSLRPARYQFSPSAEFRRRMQQQIAPPKRRFRLLHLVPAAVALAAILLVAIGWIQYSRRAQAFGEVADLHVNALASTNPYDVVSSDRHTVKPWFQGRIPFSFNLPEFANTDFTLLGGKTIYLQQQPGAQLMVETRQHKISVMIFQDSPNLGLPFTIADGASNRNNFNVETWQSRGLRFFVIGDVDSAEIDRLSEALKKANQ